MVRIHVKNVEKNGGEFMYDCELNSMFDEIAKEVIEIANFQSQFHHLATLLQPRFSPLLRTHRSQVIPLMRAVSEAQSYASKEQVLHDRPLLLYLLREQFQIVEREFMENHLIMGIPDPNIQAILKDLELLDVDKTQLWWAGKELTRGKTLSHYIGNNEKTKIVIMLRSPSSSQSIGS